MKNKIAMSKLAWIILILVLLGLAALAYFLFGSDAGIASSSSIPQPPALPS